MQSRDIPSYLTQAILVTMFCCLPFGVVAIVYAVQVNSKIQAGDYKGARESSKSAGKWCGYGFTVGFIVFILSMAVSLSG